MDITYLIFTGLSFLPTWFTVLVFALLFIMLAILVFKLIAFVMDVIPFI